MAADPFETGPFEVRGSVPPEDWLRIVITLLFSFALIAFLGLYLYFSVSIPNEPTWTRTKEAFAVILPALTGTLGTVIGFYLATATSKTPEQRMFLSSPCHAH